MKEKNTKGKDLLKILQENYEIETAQDLSGAIKDLFKDALQQMMNAEFDSSMGYSKYDKKTEKTNYRNGSTKKNLESLNLKHQGTEMESLNLKLFLKIKEMYQELKIR